MRLIGIVSNLVVGFFFYILYMSIVATVIGRIILWLKKKIEQKLSPNANYVIWLVFLIALIVPISIPSKISIYNYIDISDMKQITNLEVKQKINAWGEKDKRAAKEAIDTNISNNNKIFNTYIRTILAFIWFIIFVIRLSKKIFFYISIDQLSKNNETEDERVLCILQKCKKRLNIKRNIKVIEQEYIKMPATIGIFNVKIMITNSLLELEDNEITNIFMHELSHYKRKDNIVNVLIIFAKSLHWFNPAIGIMFKKMRSELELATDEMAVSKMNGNEEVNYCKSLIAVAAKYSLEKEEILGISSAAETLGRRIDVIARKEEFQKNAKKIKMATVGIILLICLLLYPSSYEMFKIPKLYLKLENGEQIEATRVEENSVLNEVKLSQDEQVKLVTKGGKPNDYIFYQKINLNESDMVNISLGKLSYFEKGENIYQFTLTYGNNKSMDYAIKIIVE